MPHVITSLLKSPTPMKWRAFPVVSKAAGSGYGWHTIATASGDEHANQNSLGECLRHPRAAGTDRGFRTWAASRRLHSRATRGRAEDGVRRRYPADCGRNV